MNLLSITAKMPDDIAQSAVFILDPMLATGGSASAAITFVKEYGCKSIALLNIIAAPEGINVIERDHPDVDIYVAAVDDSLNDHAYIGPWAWRCRRQNFRYKISKLSLF